MYSAVHEYIKKKKTHFTSFREHLHELVEVCVAGILFSSSFHRFVSMKYIPFDSTYKQNVPFLLRCILKLLSLLFELHCQVRIFPLLPIYFFKRGGE